MLKRSSAYSYVCGACSRCCYCKGIPLDPYAIARLATHLGLSTTEVITQYTDPGVLLRIREDGACVFLGTDGCSVHSDRPLACRLYPLGQIVHDAGSTPACEEEDFVEVEPHPDCVGIRGTDSTVADYLAIQDVEPYLEAARLYYRLYQRMVALLNEQPESEGWLNDAKQEASSALAGAFIDMDRVLSDHAARTGQPTPVDPFRKMHLHIEELCARFGLKP